MRWFAFCAALTIGLAGFAADANACCLLGLFFHPSCSGCHGCHEAPGCYGCGGYYGCSAPMMMPSPMTVPMPVPVYVPQPVGCAMPAEPGCALPAEPAVPHPEMILPNSSTRPVSNRGLRSPAPFVPPLAPPASGPLVW